MNPASQEYFHSYEMMVEELTSLKGHQNELKFQISKLYEENKRLSNELKENIIVREQQLTESGFGDLERKYQAALASKNAAIEMWQDALQQLERQEDQLVGKRSILECERSESDRLLERIREEYVKGLNVLSVEVTNYRNELSKTTQELQLRTSELEENKSEVVLVTSELNTDRKLIADISAKNSEMEEKLASLQTLLSETENFLSTTKEEMVQVKAENFEFSSLIANLKEQNKELRSQVTIFERDAKESLLAAEEAVLRKKEMAYREEQYLKDIEHLKQSVDFEAEKIALRYKSEQKEIQKQSSEKIKEMMEEIQVLHQEISDKQSLFERATREKQALESRLELLHSEFSKGTSNGTFEDLCKRLTLTERARDEYEFRVRSVETELQELRSASEQQVQCLQEECSKIKSRYYKLSEDFNRSSGDRIKLSDEVTRFKKKCYELEKELKVTKTRHASELTSLREKSQQNLQTLKEQMSSNEEHYKNVYSELQKLLDAEFKISNKWKEEADNLIVKSEAKIKELCQTITQLQNQNKELIKAYGTSNSYVPDFSTFPVHRFTSFNRNVEDTSE